MPDMTARIKMNGVAENITHNQVRTDNHGSLSGLDFADSMHTGFASERAVLDIQAQVDGVRPYRIIGAMLTRVINGVTDVPKSTIAAAREIVVRQSLIYDTQGTLGVYIEDADESTYTIRTISTSPLGSDEPSFLGNVRTDAGMAGLPQTVATAQTTFGRTPHADDYARTVNSSGVITEWHIINVGADGSVSWGNELVLNLSNSQSPTDVGMAGKLLTGGATAGTWGESIPLTDLVDRTSDQTITGGKTFALGSIRTDEVRSADDFGPILYHSTEDRSIYLGDQNGDLYLYSAEDAVIHANSDIDIHGWRIKQF